MQHFKRFGLILGLFSLVITASFADLRFGGELTAGIPSHKLFGSDQSRYLVPLQMGFSAIRLSGYVGWDTGNDTSKVAFGFEQHLGVQALSLFDVEHLPLILSCPTRIYVRFGTPRVALDILTGLDNQFVIHGSQQYPAYVTTDYHGNIIQSYAAAPTGWALGLEIGARLVLRRFYLTAIVAVPLTDNYMFPGLIRLGLGFSI